MSDPTEKLASADFEELLDSPDLDDAVQRGDVTGEQAAELLQQAARRRAAEEGPGLDTDEDGSITTGGFGAGQGMGNERTGQPPTKRSH